MIDPISLPRLLICFIPLGVLLVWFARDGMPVRPTLLALSRMTLQLLCVGYLLVFLFDSSRPWLTLLVLTVMSLAASLIAVRTGSGFSRRRWIIALLCLIVAGTFCLGTVLVFVLELWPWEQPRTVIPLAGMTLSSAMNAISLASERLDAELTADRTHADAQRTAFQAALIPMTNSLMAVGVVSIPGMMTGQVLAGVSPLIAARYQIMIMCLLFAVAGLATKLYLSLENSGSSKGQPRETAEH